MRYIAIFPIIHIKCWNTFTLMSLVSIARFSPLPYTFNVHVYLCEAIHVAQSKMERNIRRMHHPYYMISYFSGAELRDCCWKQVLFLLFLTNQFFPHCCFPLSQSSLIIQNRLPRQLSCLALKILTFFPSLDYFFADLASSKHTIR